MTKRYVRLFLISLLAGPLIGSVVFCLVIAVAKGLRDGPEEGALALAFFPVVILGGYFLGAIPAIIHTVVIVVLWRLLPGRQLHPILVFAVGAASSIPIVAGVSGGAAGWMPMAAIGVIGGFTGLASVALVGRAEPVTSRSVDTVP